MFNDSYKETHIKKVLRAEVKKQSHKKSQFIPTRYCPATQEQKSTFDRQATTLDQASDRF